MRGDVKASSPFRIASLTKPVTAVATVLAAQRAGIGLDTRVLDVLPELRDDCAADLDLAIVDVLSQISGLAATVSATDVAALGDGDDVFLESARLVLSAGSARPRAQRWEYYNGNYFVAGAVVEALTGVPFESAIAELVLRPWGLASTSFFPPADLVAGVEGGRKLPALAYPRGRRPSGGLCSTAADLMTFGHRLLQARDVLDAVRTVRTRPDDPMQYGLGWAVGPSGQMFLNGRLPGFRTALVLVPDQHFVAVGLAADSTSLPAVARVLSSCQLPLTGDDIAEAIDAFAA